MTTVRAPKLSGRIPSVDGLRAVSILLVLFGHASSTNGAPQFLDHPVFTSLGNVGVRFFFLISGFLITTLLLRELDSRGRISLRDFYLRRALRILPASLFYLGAIYACYLAGLMDLTLHLVSMQHVSSPLPDFVRALTFTANYQHDYNWYFNHLWSLSVEEQFYLIWPALLCMVGVRRGMRFCFLVVCIVPAIRTVMYLLQGPSISLSREFQASADALATGCLLSLSYNLLSRIGAYRKFAHGYLAPLLGGALIGLSYASAFLSRPAAYVIGQTFANIGAAIVLDHVIRKIDGPFGKVLNSRPFVAVGVLSYSLYLWQEPFMYFKSNAWAASFPQNIVFAFLLAALSYWMIEKPFLRLKDRWARRRTATLQSTRYAASVAS